MWTNVIGAIQPKVFGGVDEKGRVAIEPRIGHLKGEHRMNRCRRKGIEGDELHAILSVAGMNFGKLLKQPPTFLFYCARSLRNCSRESNRPCGLCG